MHCLPPLPFDNTLERFTRPLWPRGPISIAVAGLAGLVIGFAPTHSRAAGGHHAVDDAAIAEPGQCQLEAWAERARGQGLQHAGGACRVSGIEFGLSLDRSSPPDGPAVHALGAQVKWAQELQPGLSIGAFWGATWQSGSPRFAGHVLLLPLTWTPAPSLSVHLNVGRDLPARQPGAAHHGAALEWQITPAWQALAETWKDGQGSHHRAGLRYVINEQWSVDLSRAQARSGGRPAWWTLGLNLSL